MKSRSNTNDEINISYLISIILKKKWTVVFFVTVALALMFVYQKNQPPLYKIIKTEIRPITVKEEVKYKIYSSLIKSIKDSYNLDITYLLGETNFKSDEFKKNNNGEDKNVNIRFLDLSVTSIDNIDKGFLFNLTHDKLKDIQFLESLLKEFNYIEKKNYATILEYNEAIRNLASQIRITRQEVNNDKIFINFKTLDLDIKKWIEFLKFIEKKTNLEIQKNLAELSSDYIKYLKQISKYSIEDIELQMTIAVDEELAYLEKKLMTISSSSSKFIFRIQDAFNNSPIPKADEFYAAKIIFRSNNVEKEKRNSMSQMLFTAGLLSSIFGIFFVLLSNAIKNRK
jgi:hypothetical protein